MSAAAGRAGRRMVEKEKLASGQPSIPASLQPSPRSAQPTRVKRARVDWPRGVSAAGRGRAEGRLWESVNGDLSVKEKPGIRKPGMKKLDMMKPGMKKPGKEKPSGEAE